MQQSPSSWPSPKRPARSCGRLSEPTTSPARTWELQPPCANRKPPGAQWCNVHVAHADTTVTDRTCVHVSMTLQVVRPSTSLGGRRFEPIDERSLHPFVRKVATALPGAKHILLVPEMPSPLGLPDFVAAVNCGQWLASRMASGVPPVLSEIDCTVLSVLMPHRPLSVRTVANRLAWQTADIDSVLSRLTRSGAIQFTDGGSLVRHPAFSPTGTLYAIEAKVTGWQRAIRQGRSYRTWADNYIVVMGQLGQTATLRAQEALEHEGAGLYLPSGWLLKPQPRKQKFPQRLRGFEHLFAAIGSDPALGSHEGVHAGE